MEVHLPREKAKLNILEGEKEVPSGIDITVARQLTPDHTRISVDARIGPQHEHRSLPEDYKT